MFACNCCNNLMERCGYCDNCGCPEAREMKPQRFFLSMGPNYEPVVQAVQESCKTQEVQALLQLGGWEFLIEKHPVTSWWCIYIVAEFEVWSDLCKHPATDHLAATLDDFLEKERLGDVWEEYE